LPQTADEQLFSKIVSGANNVLHTYAMARKT